MPGNNEKGEEMVADWIAKHIKPSEGMHKYGDSFTGMLCGAMVTDAAGFGDICGLAASDPVHATPASST